MKARQADLEVYRYDDLIAAKDLRDTTGRAFGRDGLGIAAVTDVPDIAEPRSTLFGLAHRFASLPKREKLLYEIPSTSYSFGWSHGREMLESGRPDLNKGSFYANPCLDKPFNSDYEEVVQKYPSFAHANIWPDEHVPGFSKAFKELGQAVVRVGVAVARQCDRYVESVHAGFEADKLTRIVSTSRCCKARLLHYFPRVKSPPLEAVTTPEGITAACESGDRAQQELRNERQNETAALTSGVKSDENGVLAEADGDAFSVWCGWHNDHSCLTGLVPAIFLDENGRKVDNSDPECGLYVRSRQGELVKAALPLGHKASNCLLFQIGETMQILTGGALQATPHAVRSTSQTGVSREAFAAFMQPEWGEIMDVPRGADPSTARSLHATNLLPRGAAPINDRWRPGMNFGEFTNATFSAYY